MKRGFIENKKGQFYLLAAMIIVVLIAGFAAVNNYATKRSSTQVYDIGDELDIEVSKVYEYGTTYEKTLDNIVNDFTSQYDDYAGEGKEIYFIYGDTEEIYLITYDIEVVNAVTLVGEGGQITRAKIDQEVVVKASLDPDCRGDICIVKAEIKDDVYEFELNPGENFYFIISQTVGDEQVVVQG